MLCTPRSLTALCFGAPILLVLQAATSRNRSGFLDPDEAFAHGVEIVLPVKHRTRRATEARLEVYCQGCTDRGLCYPPMKDSARLTLPAVA